MQHLCSSYILKYGIYFILLESPRQVRLFYYHIELGLNVSYNIGIKHGFSCINIRQVPRVVLKTETGGRGFQHLPRNLANANALKNHVRSLLLHKKRKTFAIFRVIFCTILFRVFTDVSRTQFARTILILEPGSTHLVTAANLWPRYDHTESCVTVH